MAYLNSMGNQLTSVYIRSICREVDNWGETLHTYLKKYGVREKLCRRIARSRAMCAIDHVEKGLDYAAFGEIKGTEHAVRIYNAFIRHEKTGYDDFCEEVNVQLGFSLDSITMKKLWRLQRPEEFEEYEKKCIFLSKNLKRDYDGHFTF